MAIGAVALLSLGIRRAGWLAVPILWPWTQAHYMVISTPALSPTLALVWCLPDVPAPVALASVIVVAVGVRIRPIRPVDSVPSTGRARLQQGARS
jgi:hypothetical protein